MPRTPGPSGLRASTREGAAREAGPPSHAEGTRTGRSRRPWGPPRPRGGTLRPAAPAHLPHCAPAEKEARRAGPSLNPAGQRAPAQPTRGPSALPARPPRVPALPAPGPRAPPGDRSASYPAANPGVGHCPHWGWVASPKVEEDLGPTAVCESPLPSFPSSVLLEVI